MLFVVVKSQERLCSALIMWSSSTDDCSTVLDPVCDYSVHGSNTTPLWEEVDGGWPHIGTLFHQERWGEWVLFRLQRSLYVQYKLIGPPYFLEWNGLSLYSTKQTDYQRLSLCQLRLEQVWFGLSTGNIHCFGNRSFAGTGQPTSAQSFVGVQQILTLPLLYLLQTLRSTHGTIVWMKQIHFRPVTTA